MTTNKTMLKNFYIAKMILLIIFHVFFIIKARKKTVQTKIIRQKINNFHEDNLQVGLHLTL